jgi:hypothetical protein
MYQCYTTQSPFFWRVILDTLKRLLTDFARANGDPGTKRVLTELVRGYH